MDEYTVILTRLDVENIQDAIKQLINVQKGTSEEGDKYALELETLLDKLPSN